MNYPKPWTAKELTTANLENVVWIIDNLIATGLAILAGNKKLGKSFLTLDLALAIATGSKVFGEFQAKKGQVLVLALEDTTQRLQKRLLMRNAFQSDDVEFITMKDGWLRLDNGGLRMMKNWLEAHPQASCIIIDTLQTLVMTGLGYAQDCEQLRELAQLASTYKVAIIAVHHVRKTKAVDPFDELLGSQGVGATADTLLVLKRTRNNDMAVLHITGRDVGEKELLVQFNMPPGTWSFVGEGNSLCKTDERQQLWNIVAANDQTKGVPIADIQQQLAHCGIEKKPNAIRFLLHKMVKDGELQRVKKGRYATDRNPNQLSQLAMLATLQGTDSSANAANNQTTNETT